MILAGCSTPDDPDFGTAGEPDYSSHDADYSIKVRNNTGMRLVAFKGELKAETLIGGIPAHTLQPHGLPKNPALFNKTEDFPLILLTEAQYKANKDNLGSQENAPFTRLYVFYKQGGGNVTIYEIAGCLGESNTLIISNPSNFNVELRVEGVSGEILGYAPAGMYQTRFYLRDGDYSIYPVFKWYNPVSDTVETVYPTNPGSDNAWFQAFTFSGGTIGFLDLTDLLASVKTSTSSAW